MFLLKNKQYSGESGNDATNCHDFWVEVHILAYMGKISTSCHLYHSVHPPFCWGVEPPTRFSKQGRGLDRILRGLLGKWETFSRGGAVFS